MNDLMTTREVAAYLRLKERKVYEMVRNGEIPCTRVTGKWLFPKSMIDLWLMEHAEGPGRERLVEPPAVVSGSHDPLLEWALQASACGYASLLGGSGDGLARFAAGEAAVCGLHIPDSEGDGYNVEAVQRANPRRDVVLIEWARRRQGLMVAPGNPRHIGGLSDLEQPGVRVIDRQEGAGSRLLLDRLLQKAGIDRASLGVLEDHAVSETDVAREVHAGHADVGLGIEAAAREAGLDFVPLAEERFDLLLARRSFFEPPFQALLALTRTSRFAERARTLGGYDVSATGSVHYNAG